LVTADPLSFAVQAVPTAAEAWVALARRVEAEGFATLCVADHPGTTVSPFVALGAAAAVTSVVGLGTAVVNVGVREPVDIAADVATLDRLSAGRAELGVGAGHTPSEWTAVGRAYPPAGERIERLVEAIPLLRALLDGERVNHDGRHFRLRAARLEYAPTRRVPLLVGGNRALARATAAMADVIEVSGLGRTLPDGQFHELRWSTDDVDRLVAAVHEGAGPSTPRLGALVQLVEVTDDAERAATRFLTSAAERLPRETLPTVAELLAGPFVLIGTVTEIVEQLIAARTRWGFTRYTVRVGALDVVAGVMRVLETS
jgi:probable F420-dependent oxidoreductase